MLLASLHRHAQRGVPGSVFRYADNTAWHGAFEFIFGSKEGRVRAAVAHRHAEALGRAEDDIRPLLAWCGQQYQRHKVCRYAHHNLACFQLAYQRAVVMHFTGSAYLLEQHAEEILMIQRLVGVVDHDLKAKGFCAGAHHVQGLRMHIGGDKEAVRPFQLAHAFGHRHRFGACGRFIKQRRGGDIETGEIQRDLLEVKQCLKAALRDFRLIRGIGGVPARVFQHIAQDHRRQLHGGVAHADVRLKALVARGDGFQLGQRGKLRGRFANLRRRCQLNVLRDNLANQGVK